MNPPEQTAPPASDKKAFKGYEFSFDVEGHLVEAFGSTTSGLERIWVDGQLVSEKRSFKLKSTHALEIDGKPYTITFHVRNVLKGNLHCALSSEEQAIQAFIAQPKVTQSYITFVLCLIIGMAFGMLAGYLRWPFWSFFIFFGLFLILGNELAKKTMTIQEDTL